MHNNKKLTKSEWKVMELLWEKGEAMTPSQIAECAEGWKPSYVHLLINSLIKKGAIEVSDFVRTTKNFARAFVPSLTREQCMVREILGESPDGEEILLVVKELVKMANVETKERIKEFLNDGV